MVTGHLVTGHIHLGAWESSSVQETPGLFRILTTLPTDSEEQGALNGHRETETPVSCHHQQGLAPGPCVPLPLRGEAHAARLWTTRPDTDSCASSTAPESYQPPSVRALDRRPPTRPCTTPRWLPTPTAIISKWVTRKL